MNYELAKQLKEAGFPQKGYRDSEQPKGWIAPYGDYGDWKVNDDYIYVPTLSELIEACGDRFISLFKGGYWVVESINPSIQTNGRTPEEAVAKLWLELNKK